MVHPRESALLLRTSYACFCMAFKELSVLHFTLGVCVHTCGSQRTTPGTWFCVSSRRGHFAGPGDILISSCEVCWVPGHPQPVLLSSCSVPGWKWGVLVSSVTVELSWICLWHLQRGFVYLGHTDDYNSVSPTLHPKIFGSSFRGACCSSNIPGFSSQPTTSVQGKLTAEWVSPTRFAKLCLTTLPCLPFPITTLICVNIFSSMTFQFPCLWFLGIGDPRDDCEHLNRI